MRISNITFWKIEALPPSPEQVDHEEAAVGDQGKSGAQPDQDVADQVDLGVGVLGDEVGDPAGQERPLSRLGGVVVVLDVLLVGDQHLDLELQELLPEAEVGRLLGDHLLVEQLPLQGLLILVI